KGASTLVIARTSVGPTPWRAAADSMALSTDSDVISRPRTRSAVSGDSGSDTLKDAFRSGAAATTLVTSSAALRAAFIMAGEGGGAALDRLSPSAQGNNDWGLCPHPSLQRGVCGVFT